MNTKYGMAVAAAAGLALGGAAHASFYEINLTGFTLVPTQHTEGHNVAAAGGTVTMIEWNLVYEAGSAVGTGSWASELSIDLAAPGYNLNTVVASTGPGGFFPATPGDFGTFIWGSPDTWSPGFAPGADANSHNLDWPSSSAGVHSSSGSTNVLDGLSADGLWQLGIYDSYDDGSQGIFHDNSWIRIHYTPVPAPGALALLGVAGLLGARRRRG